MPFLQWFSANAASGASIVLGLGILFTLIIAIGGVYSLVDRILEYRLEEARLHNRGLELQLGLQHGEDVGEYLQKVREIE